MGLCQLEGGVQYVFDFVYVVVVQVVGVVGSVGFFVEVDVFGQFVYYYDVYFFEQFGFDW